MESGIFLSRRDISTLSPSTQQELRDFLGGGSDVGDGSPDSFGGPNPQLAEDDGGPADLSPAQANRLIAGCSDRPKKALRFIAAQPNPSFSYNALLKHLGEDGQGGIRGVTSAITRRTRTVLGDSKADLMWWKEDEAESWIGSVSSMTHSSLKKALGLA